MKRIQIEQGSSVWKEFRRDHITSTDASVIMGVNPFKTPLQLFMDKILNREQYINDSMRRGSELEPKAREWAEGILQVKLEPAVVVSDEFTWAMSSLDGINQGRRILIEIKCPEKSAHEKAKKGEIKDYYRCQIQHHLFVTGYQRCHYISFDGEDGVIIIIDRDENFIQEMIKAELEFLYKLRDCIAPNASLNDFMPRPDELWNSTAKMLLEAKRRKEEAENEEIALKEKLIEISRGYNSTGSGIRLQKVISRGAIDYSSIEELKGIDLEKYRKVPRESWRVTEIT